MKTYQKNGTMHETKIYSDYIEDFCVQEMPNAIEKFSYKGDSIRYELDMEFVKLYDKFRDLLFPDTEK